jgi:hypothetical protein
VKVLRDATGGVSLGCDPAEYVNQGAAGKIVVVQRGVCARVARAIFGQKAGAKAVVMINNTTGLPPFEGEITSNPDTGEAYTVTIPFFGVRGLVGTGADATKLVAADGTTISITNTTVPNTGYKASASFTSGGPRQGDSAAKPEITAPGVSVTSALVGSGSKGTVLSGTSMAAPMTSGTAALVKQAHPLWSGDQVKAALVNTVPAGGSVPVDVTAAITAAQFAALPGASSFTTGVGAVVTRRGAVTVTPTTSGAGNQPLRVPALIVPRGLSSVQAAAVAAYVKQQTQNIFTTSTRVSNTGIHSGTADVYAWGIHDTNDLGTAAQDVRDVGVQSFSDGTIVFAVNGYNSSSTQATQEYGHRNRLAAQRQAGLPRSRRRPWSSAQRCLRRPLRLLHDQRQDGGRRRCVLCGCSDERVHCAAADDSGRSRPPRVEQQLQLLGQRLLHLRRAC